jgi:hypothetical protein
MEQNSKHSRFLPAVIHLFFVGRKKCAILFFKKWKVPMAFLPCDWCLLTALVIVGKTQVKKYKNN